MQTFRGNATTQLQLLRPGIARTAWLNRPRHLCRLPTVGHHLTLIYCPLIGAQYSTTIRLPWREYKNGPWRYNRRPALKRWTDVACMGGTRNANCIIGLSELWCRTDWASKVPTLYNFFSQKIVASDNGTWFWLWKCDRNPKRVKRTSSQVHWHLAVTLAVWTLESCNVCVFLFARWRHRFANGLVNSNMQLFTG